MSFLMKWRLVLGFVLCSVIGVMASAYPGRSSSALEELSGTQDVRSLERRISLLDQRLYSIERSINRLEQSALSQRAPLSQTSVRDPEINLLREEIGRLQFRLSEVECGLIKVDERTKTSTVGVAPRGPSSKSADPCRLNPATPLRLSSRP